MLTPTELRYRETKYDAALDCRTPLEIEGRRRERERQRREIDSIRRRWREMDLSPKSRAKLDEWRQRREESEDEAANGPEYAEIIAERRQLIDDALLPESARSDRLAANMSRLDAWHARHEHLTKVAPMNVLNFPQPQPKLIQTSAQFVADFVAPSYLLDGILQRRFVYSLTAATGAGKTAIALRLAAHVALGRKLGDRDVQKGRVLYFASENSVDVQARWIAAAQHMAFDPNTIDVFFVAGATKLSEIADRITHEAAALGDLALVIVDTSAATFEGADENSNVDALQHAKRLRSLTDLQGGPTALVLTHPVKSATNENLSPRGGGAFVAEIDGNLVARKNDSAVELHWSVKFRGMDFAPMLFRLDTVTADRLKDAKNRNIPTVLASPMDDAAKDAMTTAQRRDEDIVLQAIEKHPGASSNELAKALGWFMRDNRPYGVRVRRAADKLSDDGLILKFRGNWTLSGAGQKELNRLEQTGTNARNSVVSMPPVFPPIPGRNL